MVDDQAEHVCCPAFVGEGGREPLLAHGFVWVRSAREGEGGVCEGGVLDVRAPGDLVADVVWVLVGEEGGGIDGCWDWGEGIACLDCEAFGFKAVCVAVVVD